MKLLLAADPAAQQAMAKLGPGFNFQDVDPNNREQLEACAALAGGIKRLVAEMVASVRGTVGERLPSTLGHSVSDTDVRAMVAGLSADTVRRAANAWAIGGSPPAGANNANHANANDQRKSLAFDPAGAWFYDDVSLSVRYRPAGHADPVMAAWLNTLAGTPNLDQHPLAAAMFKELTKPNVPGLCASCHSAEKLPAGDTVINWRAYDRTGEPRGFTKFAHGPHLLLQQLVDCTHCHSIDAAASSAPAYTGLDAVRFVSDFAPISKRQCVECHTAKAAGDRCQQCHNYHVGHLPIGDCGLQIEEKLLESAIRNPKSEIR
jgi:hypothetical protein